MKNIYTITPIAFIVISVFTLFKPTTIYKEGVVNKISVIGKKTVSIESFGAKANDPGFDNAPAIIKALNNADNIIIPANKNFTILSTIQVSNLSGRTITATNAAIVNRIITRVLFCSLVAMILK